MLILTGSSLSERTLLTPGHREFWEKLCGWVAPTEEGGGIDIFSPLGASGRYIQKLNTHFSVICIFVSVSPSSCVVLSASGLVLIQTLSTLTGLEVRAPMGLATGSFQNSESPKTDST